MCGIIGYIGVEEKATNMIIEGLSKLEYRGYDSAGIAIFTPSGIRVEKTKGKLINLADPGKFFSVNLFSICHFAIVSHKDGGYMNSVFAKRSYLCCSILDGSMFFVSRSERSI